MPSPAAIVGIGCRLPGGADTPGAFWRLLRDGVDAITEIPEDRFDVDAVFDPDPAAPGKIYSRWGGFVHDVDRFDADFFGIAPREAKRLDPQHRLLLEVAWEALEDGGVVPERLAGTSTGVFIGISTHDYADMHMAPGQRSTLDAHVNIGNALSVAPNRISYLLDLRGPSMAIETACSSSLTALHLACRSLAAGESSAAIVAGVNLVLSPDLTIGFCKASMISPDGRCRAFDAGANGYVRSEGAGAIVLKPLDRALADRDPIYAVVHGTAINEDGRTTGISLPSADAQEVLIRQALRDAGIAPSDVHYVEAHGTGTPAGDPAEAEAFGRALGRGRPPERPLLIGSAKTNVGHLEAASGITGLIKSALMLRHRQVPASLHFDAPNPAIAFGDLRLRVPTVLEAWPAADAPATIGVNSSGFGGSNAHVVLREAPPRGAVAPASGHRQHLLPISARTATALSDAAKRYRERLIDCDEQTVAAICAGAATRRTHFEHRLGLVGASADELIEGIDAFLAGEARPDVVAGHSVKGRPPKLAFVFAGMGPQWWGMGRQLLSDEPRYRACLETCDEVIRPLAGWSLLDALAADETSSRIGDTRIVQVVNCAFQIALADLWRVWGVVPDAVIGHSAGEMAAAHVAGALSLRDALHVSFHRGRLLHRASGTGRMLAAAVSADEAAPYVEAAAGRVALAAVNSATSVTLSGEAQALGDIARRLEQRERFCRFLPTDVPYHGPQMDTVREELLAALHDLQPRAATIPMVSEVSGTWLGSALLDGEYWWRNIRQSVLFGPCVLALIDEGYDLFCEISPHPVLAAYVQEGLAERGRTGSALASLRRHEDERRTMLRALAALHVRGRDVDWAVVHGDAAHVELPTYPWQRERFWFDPPPVSGLRHIGVDSGHPLLGSRSPSPNPTWQVPLGDPRLAYLDEHVVEDTAVFPGAGYVAMSVAAGRRVTGAAEVTLERIEFRKLLFLDAERCHTLQLQHHPRDGSIEIHGAPDHDLETWTLHATATLRPTTPSGSLGHIDLQAIRARCPDLIDADEHHRALERYGFHYGPAFRGLEWVWSGPSEAVARVRCHPGSEGSLGPYEVHPALLDAAFQLLAGAGAFAPSGASRAGPLFPVAIRRVAFARPPGGDFWVHASVRTRDDGRIEGDVTLTDDDGAVALVCEAVRLDALDRPGSLAAAAGATTDHLYELRWEERPLAHGPRRRAAVVDAPTDPLVLASLADPERDPGVVAYHALVRATLDRVARGYARLALRRLGWDGEEAIDGETLGVVPRHRRVLRRLLATLCGRSEVAPHSHAALRSELDALVRREPAFAAEAELLRRGGESLEGVLSGRTDPRDVLLSGEALEVLARMYHDSPACRAYHTLLADAVASALEPSVAGEPPRVLEVGAGTGAATASIISRLPPATDYLFTDVSPHFLTSARARFGSYPGTRFGVLDLEAEPEAQGFVPGSFDLVVAANVVHTTVDAREALRRLRRLLAPGGLLVTLELTHPGFWVEIVFGLLDGWWRFEDVDLRPDHPLLDDDGWRGAAEEAGYECVASLPARTDGAIPIQTIVLGQAPAAELGEGRAGSGSGATVDGPRPGDHAVAGEAWLILADASGVGAALAEALEERGASCTLMHHARRADATGELAPDDPETFVDLLASLERAPQAIVHLWSLDGVSAVSTDEVMDVQRLGSGSVMALAQAIERLPEGRPRALWLVTAGAQPVEDHDGAPAIAQSPLWGLGRVVMSEQLVERCRLVDLGPDPTREEIRALATELTAGEAEEELALRGGRRYVRRLQRAHLPVVAERGEERSLSPRADAFRLALDGTGTLGGLLLRETRVRTPGPGEVSIRVRASGLNFRDVLQALGMLPAAALATDPDPGAVGIECSGVVEACGPGVDDLRPGDEVVALAWGAHGSLVVTSAHLTAPKPSAASFAEAASVCNAFVTADYALGHVGRLAAGERVLIHSAAGAVGLAAIQYCRRAGAEVFATSGTEEKRAYLRSLGIDHVMDSRSLDFVEQVRSATNGEGVDLVLNSLSGEAMLAGLDLLRPYGRFVELGKRDIYGDARIGLLPFGRNLSYTAVDLVQLALDRPDRAKQLLLTAVAQVDDGTFTPVPCTTFDLAEAEAAFRFMAQARHIGKVVLTVEEERYPVRPELEPPLCRPDGTYLITGGLGGLGLATADMLVHQGARHIVLMSRSGLPKAPADDDALAALMASDARVEVVRGDASRAADVSRVLERIRAEMPPLRGVLHAAMVLDDDALARLDGERLRAVLEPKVAGAWNLHRLSADDPIEFFVLFSSIASIVGHPMQANYAAANAFLDALAEHRRARGLPALTVAWGAVTDVGYVARHRDVQRYVTRGGFAGFTPGQACELLEGLLRRGAVHSVAARIDWEAFGQANPALAHSRRFEAFLRSDRDGDRAAPLGEHGAGVVDALRLLGPEERLAAVDHHLVRLVARVLGASEERIDPDRPLTESGFDSLMAAELVTAVESELKVRPSVVKVLQGGSARDLAAVVLGMLVDEGLLDADGPRPLPHDEVDATPGTPRDRGDAAPNIGVPSEPEAAPAPEVHAEHGARAEDEHHLLSFEQRRFWFLHRLDPDDPAYNVPTAVRLKGALDVGALQRSLDAVVERHEMLRATYREIDGEPVQTFGPPRPAPLELIDLRTTPEATREAELQRQATAAIRRAFDLERALPLRAQLFRIGEREHVLVLVVHHIACDAWSMHWLVREVATLYGADVAGATPELPPPAFRYSEYVRRQHERSGGDALAAQLGYWTRHLAGSSADLRFPGEAHVRRGATRSGAHLHFELPEDLTAALEHLSTREGATLFTTLLAAFQTLLGRWTGVDDVCVGSAVTNRDGRDSDDVVGCFINTVALRGDLSGDPTFRELMRRSRAVTLAALEHKDVPFERVVQAVRPDGADAASPLFQAMLVLHGARLPELRVSGLDIGTVEVESGATVADLVLLLATGDAMTATLEYDADRFDTATANRLVRHYRMLLEGVVADPDRRLSALPLMDDDELDRVLVRFNDTGADLAPAMCLHESVAAQARATPHAVALTCGATDLTYADLAARSNRLAHHLRRRGVARGSIVGLLVARSINAVVALLAVLEAGGAYLPLDPGDPPERLRRQLEEAGAEAVLTDRAAGGIPPLGGAAAVIDVADAPAGAGSEGPLESGVGPADLAYVIFTSGSTGRPKGVMIEHRAVHNLLSWRRSVAPLAPSDVGLSSTRLTFDPSVPEIFAPLCVGARLVLPEPHDDVGSLPELIERERVTTLQAVPSLLEALLDAPGIERCTSLERVFCGGEPLRGALQERFFARLRAELHHVYGPTEATVEATHWRCTREHAAPLVPIGRPIANTVVYVLDAARRPVPIGLAGELYLGGAGVARGYVGSGSACAERFVADPFADAADGRLFRTGDVGRWRDDGNLEFLGRVDRQVKVRGVRVDPVEVETVLLEHPEVQEAAVVSTLVEGAQRQLVAFVAPASAAPADLRRHAARRLPRAMVPAAIVPQRALPRTASGKVDLERLTRAAREVRDDAEAAVRSRLEARDGVEVRLQRVFESLLPGRRVGVRDDFFELGGHSLLAMRAVARIHEAFGADVSVSSLLQERTVEGVARLLRTGVGSASPLVPLQPDGRGAPLVLVHPVSGTVFSYVQLARALGDDRPVLALEARGLREGEEPLESIEEMAHASLATLRSVRPDGPYQLAGWSLGGLVAFEMARALERDGERVEGLTLLDTRPTAPRGATSDEAMRQFGESLGLAADDLAPCAGGFWNMQHDEQIGCVLEHARRAGAVPPDMEVPALRRQIAVFAANLRAVQRYEPRPYGGRIVLLEPAETAGPADEPGPAWDDLAAGGVARHTVPGNHHTMLQEPHVHAAAHVLAGVLRPVEAIDGS